MPQMTVKRLYEELGTLMKQGMEDKVIVLANDNEANGFHGCFYSCTSDPDAVKESLDFGGLFDSCETDANNIVIVG